MTLYRVVTTQVPEDLAEQILTAIEGGTRLDPELRDQLLKLEDTTSSSGVVEAESDDEALSKIMKGEIIRFD